MNKITLGAVNGSIEKWEKVADGTGVDQSERNCPLCQLFPWCEGCPVHKKTKKPQCFNTPWKKWDDHQYNKHHMTQYIDRKVMCPKCKELAQAEVDFLKSLLPINAREASQEGVRK